MLCVEFVGDVCVVLYCCDEVDVCVLCKWFVVLFGVIGVCVLVVYVVEVFGDVMLYLNVYWIVGECGI